MYRVAEYQRQNVQLRINLVQGALRRDSPRCAPNSGVSQSWERSYENVNNHFHYRIARYVRVLLPVRVAYEAKLRRKRSSELNIRQVLRSGSKTNNRASVASHSAECIMTGRKSWRRLSRHAVTYTWFSIDHRTCLMLDHRRRSTLPLRARLSAPETLFGIQPSSKSRYVSVFDIHRRPHVFFTSCISRLHSRELKQGEEQVFLFQSPPVAYSGFLKFRDWKGWFLEREKEKTKKKKSAKMKWDRGSEREQDG